MRQLIVLLIIFCFYSSAFADLQIKSLHDSVSLSATGQPAIVELMLLKDDKPIRWDSREGLSIGDRIIVTDSNGRVLSHDNEEGFLYFISMGGNKDVFKIAVTSNRKDYGGHKENININYIGSKNAGDNVLVIVPDFLKITSEQVDEIHEQAITSESMNKEVLEKLDDLAEVKSQILTITIFGVIISISTALAISYYFTLKATNSAKDTVEDEGRKSRDTILERLREASDKTSLISTNSEVIKIRTDDIKESSTRIREKLSQLSDLTRGLSPELEQRVKSLVCMLDEMQEVQISSVTRLINDLNPKLELTQSVLDIQYDQFYFLESILEKIANIEASLSEFKPVHIQALVEIVDEVLQKRFAA